MIVPLLKYFLGVPRVPTVADDIKTKKTTAAAVDSSKSALDAATKAYADAQTADAAADAAIKADVANGPVLNVVTNPDGSVAYELAEKDDAAPAGYAIRSVPVASGVPSAVPPSPAPAPAS
jgi:hypothetical protein